MWTSRPNMVIKHIAYLEISLVLLRKKIEAKSKKRKILKNNYILRKPLLKFKILEYSFMH